MGFYRTSLGNDIQKQIFNHIKSMWYDVKNMTLCGIGYAIPYIEYYKKDSNHVFALMLSNQGVCQWPTTSPYAVALVHSDAVPLEDNSVDRILCIHGLEHTENTKHFLDEIWRVLAPQGEVIFVVPNRRGLWARSDNTPFGSGYPYTRRQLRYLLSQAMLTPVDFVPALFTPPYLNNFWKKTAPICNYLGKKIMPRYAGVHIVRVMKQVYIQPKKQIVTVKSPLFIPKPVWQNKGLPTPT
jgi:SAM-dependent methyltransferase